MSGLNNVIAFLNYYNSWESMCIMFAIDEIEEITGGRTARIKLFGMFQTFLTISSHEVLYCWLEMKQRAGKPVNMIDSNERDF